MKLNFRILYLLSAFICLNTTSLQAQTKVLSEEELLLKEKDMQWFRDAKFGMFIHWGLYSIMGQGEWGMFNKRIDIDKYAELAKQFEAKKFNADEWASV